jgi:hypothetical protein
MGGVPALVNLNELIQSALDAFAGDLTALEAEARSLVSLAPEGHCRDKAQGVLDDAVTQLNLLGTAPDATTIIKVLTTAAKNVLKGQTLAEALAECDSGGGGGGGGGGNWYDWTLDVTVNGAKFSAYENGMNGGPDVVGVTYFSNGGLAVNAYKLPTGYPGLSFTANIGGSPVGKTQPIASGGSYSDGVNSYTITVGSIKITQWPSTFPGRGQATFSFTATGTAGTVSGTAGSFSVWIYAPF